jgi:D-amino peptidase
MRVVMLCDMEGIGCITQWEQVSASSPLYEEGRALYTAEVNAAVRGARRAGAKEIIVVDSHGAGGGRTFNSLVKDRLEPGAEYVFGHRYGCHVDPLRDGCDALLMPGAHAMSGTPDGVLSHTISSESWHNAWINGKPAGETALVAGIAGSFGVPLVFVSGDAALVREARALLGDGLAAACVKQGLGRFSARCLAPADSCDLIEATVEDALKNRDRWLEPWVPAAPAELKVEFSTPDKTAEYRNKRAVEVTGPREAVSRADNLWQAWDQFWR